MTAVDSTIRIAAHMEAWFQRLVVGDLVEVRWTNSHQYFAGRAQVAKINKQSLRCTLLEWVATDGLSYPVGQTIIVPAQYAPRWSPNNGVFPLPPIQGILIDAKGARVERPERSDAAIKALLGVLTLIPHDFYVSTHTQLLVGAQFVALQDGRWPEKLLPIYEGTVPLRGPLFIVRRALVSGGYWQSLSSADIAAFQRLFGIVVREVAS